MRFSYAYSDPLLLQAVMFVMGLDKCILGGGEVAMRHHMKLKDATVGVVNSILYVRRLIKQKGGLESESQDSIISPLIFRIMGMTGIVWDSCIPIAADVTVPCRDKSRWYHSCKRESIT